jgi:ATP synthase F1 complex assembly factor 1
VYQEKLSNAPPPPSPPSTPPFPSSATTTATTATTTDAASAQAPPTPPGSPTGASIPKAHAALKTLSSFLDVPKTRALPPREIESIWRLRHAASARSLCATMPSEVYARLEATARRHPQFVLPLAVRRGESGGGESGSEGVSEAQHGAEIHFLQWTFPAPDTSTVLFTHLAEYKLRGEYAQPHTTVTHHCELAADKGVVLLQGAVVEGRGVSVDDGRALLWSLQKFYAGGGGAEGGPRAELLERFTRGDERFRIEDVVEEAEKLV